MSKKYRLRIPFDSQHVKVSETMLKSERQYSSYVFLSLWAKWSCKNSLLVIYEVQGLFVTLNANGKTSLGKSENLQQPIQMQLSEKQKTSSKSSSTFLKSPSNFEHFQTKHSPHSLCILEIMDCQIRGLINLEKVLFQNTVQEPKC